ncbi:hypothetical protein [Bacteroides sp.]|uniref:hypothetical protein n=1 Tax=Bacteroides sp. TaxID=29523 RepID=UPI003AB73962
MRMERKVNISCFGIRSGLFLLLVVASQLLSAQEDSTRFARDSVRIKPEINEPFSSSFELSPEMLVPSSVLPSSPSYSMPDFSLKEPLYLPYHTNPSLLFRGDYNTSGVVGQFSHGTLFGSGGQTSVPGIGRFNDASLMYQHALNRQLSFQLGMNAMKINMIHATGQAFSASGALLYRPSERIAFKVFGSYAIGNTYGMDTHRYGATMSLDMSSRFGVEIGVQRYYDSMRGRWETVPIVIPYYNFDKFKLGLDVGGLLYEIFRDAVYGDRWRGGPTIAPPRFQMPPLR